MFEAESQLFCHRLRTSEAGLVREGLSPRYTMMTLLGLSRYAARGGDSPIEIHPILNRLLGDTGRIVNIGDLGLLLWLCAEATPDRLRETVRGVDPQRAFGRSREVQEGHTMELAWFLSGVAHIRLVYPQEFPELTDLAVSTYQALKKNQGDHGIFGHLARKGTLSGVLRGRIGSFADQVYPIYALSKFAQAYTVHPALDMARRCAEAICRAQGPQGQWWWHYDSATGRVVERHPVYSVHQDGMAPMALFALEEAGGLDFSEAIYKGLRWIYGNNELQCDLRDATAGVIWRSVYQGNPYKRYMSNARTLLGVSQETEATGDFHILRECRPYHLGWLLYAFAGR